MMRTDVGQLVYEDVVQAMVLAVVVGEHRPTEREAGNLVEGSR